MPQHKIKYRAKGGFDYEFTFTWTPQLNGWRVYIDRQPGYGNRNASEVATHRLGTNSRPYVCWTTPLRSYEDARQVAALWADSTQQYIATGVFGVPPQRPRVSDASTLAGVSEDRLRAAARTTPTTLPTTHRPTGPMRRLLERLG